MEAHVQWDLVAEGFRSDWTDVGAVRMHARVSTRRLPPDAPRIVLVHGIGVSGRYLMPTATRLAQIFRVYVPDLPGFGLSTKPSEMRMSVFGASMRLNPANRSRRPCTVRSASKRASRAIVRASIST